MSDVNNRLSKIAIRKMRQQIKQAINVDVDNAAVMDVSTTGNVPVSIEYATLAVLIESHETLQAILKTGVVEHG